MNYIIEIYDPYCSTWTKVATLPFAPKTSLVESLVAGYVNEYSCSIDRWRVKYGRKVVGTHYYSGQW